MSNNLQLVSEISEMLTLADKKGLKNIQDVSQRLSRLTAILANQELTSTNNNFFGYVDLVGNKSDGSKGMMVAFHVKFKKVFGFKVDNSNTEIQSQFVRTARLAVAKIMANGIQNQHLRDDVKAQCWEKLEQLAQAYKGLENE